MSPADGGDAFAQVGVENVLRSASIPAARQGAGLRSAGSVTCIEQDETMLEHRTICPYLVSVSSGHFKDTAKGAHGFDENYPSARFTATAQRSQGKDGGEEERMMPAS
jgi:hypothetical protein